MANKNKKLNHDELFDIAIKSHNKKINKESASINSQWKSLEDNFIKEGIWEESIFSKIFHWPSRTIDRIALAVRSFLTLFVGILIALSPQFVIMQNVTRGSDEENKEVIYEPIQFSSIIERSEENPISASQQIIISAIKENLIVEISQSKNEKITLIIKNLQENQQIGLKALLGIPLISSGNIKIIINAQDIN